MKPSKLKPWLIRLGRGHSATETGIPAKTDEGCVTYLMVVGFVGEQLRAHIVGRPNEGSRHVAGTI